MTIRARGHETRGRAASVRLAVTWKPESVVGLGRPARSVDSGTQSLGDVDPEQPQRRKLLHGCTPVARVCLAAAGLCSARRSRLQKGSSQARACPTRSSTSKQLGCEKIVCTRGPGQVPSELVVKYKDRRLRPGHNLGHLTRSSEYLAQPQRRQTSVLPRSHTFSRIGLYLGTLLYICNDTLRRSFDLNIGLGVFRCWLHRLASSPRVS